MTFYKKYKSIIYHRNYYFCIVLKESLISFVILSETKITTDGQIYKMH